MLELDNLCLHCMGQLDHPDELCPHCGANPTKTSNAPNQLESGSILAGTYLVGCVLGQGGFGITYIGLDLNLNLKVAIKEYFPEGYVTREGQTRATVMPLPGERKALFERGRERFVSEAKTLAKFGDDPSIVGVRTFFYENGTAYIVMNYVEGVTLKEFAAKRGGKLPAREVLAMMEPLFVSLSKVHAAGLLHRDISPDNIMRKKSGALILLDFGAARQMSIAGEHSNTINVKHGFAPEEQYRTRGEQGPWTDVYALSATIYRLTTWVTPPEALDRMVDDTLIVSPTQLGANFSPAQEAALMHGLAVRASARTKDIAQFARELYGRNVTAFTQPCFGTEPEQGSAKAENDAKQFALKANPAAVNQNESSTGKNIQKNGNQKPSSLIRSAATFVMFFAVLTLMVATYNQLGEVLRLLLIATLIIGLDWLCLSLGILGKIDKTRKSEKVTSIILLSVGSLLLVFIPLILT